MFAFFLVLTVGWLFVSERRQGTIKRLRAAPLHNSQIVLGKLLPVYLISVGQGLFLLAAGKLVFGMRWGPETWAIGRQILWLMPVVLSTSLAAMGLALLIASLARTETQVAIYGTPLVLVLAGISGCLMPRDLMPQIMKDVQPGNTPCLGAGGVSAVADQSLSGLASRRTCLPGPCRIWSGISRAGVGDAEA